MASYNKTPVKRLVKSKLRAFVALFALLAFSGDIVADAVADLRGDHCVSENSSSDSDSHPEKSPCSHCSCAVHNGSVVASTGAFTVSRDTGTSFLIVHFVQTAVPADPQPIDHPPQLA